MDDTNKLNDDQGNKLKRKRHDDDDDGDLKQLLDVSMLNTDTDISTRFDAIANALLYDYSLFVTANGKVTELEIIELEFYLLKSGIHEDPFTHGSDAQKHSGQWYFHRAPTRSTSSHTRTTAAGGFRGGTRKGLDLTIGAPPYFSDKAPSDVLRGGILLRTLRRTADSKIISGPSLLVDEILRLSACTSIADIVNCAWASDISAFPPNRPTSLSLRPKSSPMLRAESRPPIYRSPRIGLDLSQAGTAADSTHPRAVYIGKAYRYFILPRLLTANGRSQTFLGVYRACLESGRYDGGGEALRRAVVGLTGLSEGVVGRYVGEYEKGLEGGRLGEFLGSAGKGATASPGGYLRMIGTLDRLASSSKRRSESDVA